MYMTGIRKIGPALKNLKNESMTVSEKTSWLYKNAMPICQNEISKRKTENAFVFVDRE